MKLRRSIFRRLRLSAGLLLTFLCQTSWAYQPVLVDERPVLPETVTQDISRTPIESVSLLDFFAQRTKIGVGFDEAFNDNIRLEDNAKQEDYISTLEGLLFFADPHGSLLYGGRWEINAYRYHRSDANAIDHDVLGFVDFDPGGRLQLHLDYLLLINNRLTFGTEGIDILRRSTDFQHSVEHAWLAKARYALNETNALVPSIEYSLFDDQTLSDASTDRKKFRAILDLDHDLTPSWTLFGGYTFEDYFIRGDKLKNFRAHGARLGVRHEVSEADKLEASFEIQRGEFKDTTQDTNPSFYAKWKHEVNRRTTFEIRYGDTRVPSFGTGRRRFRTRSVNTELHYDLTPLIVLTLKASGEKLRSGASDLTRGSTLQAETSQLYELGCGLTWQVREQTKVTLDYSYKRSTSRDYTNNVVALSIETSF